MGKKVEPAKLEDLFSLFENVLAPEDVLCAKVMSQASRAIIRERLNLQMNQKEFAEHIHATQSLVSRWERGDYNFSIKKLSGIASALDMNLHISMTPIKNRSEEFNSGEKMITTYWNNPRTYIQKKCSSISTIERHVIFTTTKFINEVV